MRVHIASAAAPWLVELAVLSARRRSSMPIEFIVGDSVGNLAATVERLRRSSQVELEVAPGRAHPEWLDHWVSQSADGYPVFLDSDVFLRRGCWISPLLAALQRGAALVSCEISEREENVIEPVRGAVTTAMPRPAPWLMAVDAAAVKAIGASFTYANRTEDGEIIAYDVGGMVLEALRAAGKRADALPDWYRSYYSHIGGMSWRRSPDARAEPRRWLRARYARALLVAERLAARAPGLASRGPEF